MAAAVFGCLVALRNWLYRRGWLRSRRADVPVVCAGSLEVGGAGKTPLARELAARLRRRGRRVAILSRGYRGALEHRGGKVSPDDDAARVGDEALLLARLLPDVPVYVGKDRIASARWAVAEGAEVLVLDDGFQHRRLARDLDVVLLDASRPPEGLRLLPAGPLREKPSALARADLVVLRGEGAGTSSWRGPTVRVRDKALGLIRQPDGQRVPAADVTGRKVALVAAIARPERFESLCRSLGVDIVSTHFFRDHHRFRPQELSSLPAEILTTQKDAVRFPPSQPALVLEHELEIVDGEEVLDAALDRLFERPVRV